MDQPMRSLFYSALAGFIVSVPAQAAAPDEKAPSVNWQEARQFWSFQPVKPTAPPAVKSTQWAKTPLDRFILSKLEENGLTPVAAADKRTLIRRATFDLTGLPPTPEEIDAFLSDSSPTAFAKVVDRLLASPHYGESQARHWLDVARYAEDQAHTFGVKPSTNAYRYRDWVIDAFNEDLPYDRFVKLQIAADLMDDGSQAMVKNKAALGFFGLGAVYYKNSDAAKAAADELDDRVDTLTRGFLGLTVSCARCHDHKFDPIPTQDYYSIAGIFWSSKLAEISMASKKEMDLYQEGQKRLQAADKKLKDLMQSEKDKLITARLEDLPIYFVSAWKIEAKRLVKPNFGAVDQAMLDKVDPLVLDRLHKFLNRKGDNIAAQDGWFKNMPKAGTPAEPTAAVFDAARSFRDNVKAAMGKISDKKNADMLTALFGDKGVFPIPDAEVIKKMTPERKQQLEACKVEQAEAMKSAPMAPPMVNAIAEGNIVDLKVYIRGNPAKQGDVAPRRFLRVLSTSEPKPFSKGSGRLELADSIADPANPLTARVIVNRIWQQHFGRGLVGTPSNFGTLGERPTHPELLDYLSDRFVKSGWSIKSLHRDILLSAAYQASSEPDAKAMQLDPENRLLWRMSRQRLKVESWRDALLATSGKLDPKMGGPTTNLDAADNVRRTVYAKISRHELSGFLRLFDFPDANITSDRRSETTVPQQQLFVLNSDFMLAQAKAFTARLQKEEKDDPARIRRAYLLAFGRPATDDEVAIGQRYLAGKDSPEEAAKNKLSRPERYAQALLASNEFMYID
ncbi:MAG: DUF1549 and DUF1553 domain-containing protein [Planctomycetes bacterium]|nr:DUF1549 and DUF1553 domain-containing protein [Planctomycetota bacterium]